MDIQIKLTEADVRRLVKNEIERLTGQEIVESNIRIEVKSKQNYKAEWEVAAFRAEYTQSIL
jgi:DNA-binding NtrC family response regulator